MAIKYAKLGPIGTSFNSDILGIYLTRSNAIEVDESLVENRLKSFFLTGFLVEISKVEYENIKLNISNARNIPLLIVPLAPQLAVEPVEVILSEPPAASYTGNRFIIHTNPQGAWQGMKDYIAEFNGSGWTFIKPTNNLTVPIYHWGVSATYVGTYPSGKWEYDEDLVEQIQTIIPPDLSSNNFALQLFEAEQKARSQRDAELLALIQNIQNTFGQQITKAIGISIDDVAGYYDSNNVELALAEVAVTLRNQGLAINEIYQLISQIAPGGGNQLTLISDDLGLVINVANNEARFNLDYNEISTVLKPIINPPYIANSDPETPTIIGVGGVPANTVFDPEGIDHNELFYKLFNPYTVPAIGLAIVGHYSNTGGFYNFRQGYNFDAGVNWSIVKKSDPVISASITNVTDITPALPTLESPLTSGILSGNAEPVFGPNAPNGSITLTVSDGTSNPSTTIQYRFLKPTFYGGIDAADKGITDPTALYNLLKGLSISYVQKQNNTLAFNYTGKRMIIAYDANYGLLSSILDSNGFENLAAFETRLANITTNDLDHNYTTQLRIYEGILDNGVNASWQFKF